MPHITINDANYYYELHGKGSPLVLISGYGGIGQSWMPLVEHLTQHFQVLTFDNRAVGQTVDNEASLTAELIAEDIIVMCNELKLKKPHIVGRSMGGNIALTIGALYPNQISKLGILVSAAKWRQATLNALKYQTQLQELQLNTEIQTEISLSWILSEKSYQNKAFLTMLKNNPNPQSITNQKRQFNIIQKFNGLDYLRKIRAPTLIGYGAEDILALPGDSKYLAQHIANAKLVEFQCGHIIVLEQTQQLADELINFLHE